MEGLTPRRREESQRGIPLNKRRTWFVPWSVGFTPAVNGGTLSLIQVGLTGLVMAWSPVDEGNVGVVTQWGDATGEVLRRIEEKASRFSAGRMSKPGSNYIQPVRQKSNEIPTRPQTVDMQVDILSALNGEDSHGTAPLGWDVYGL